MDPMTNSDTSLIRDSTTVTPYAATTMVMPLPASIYFEGIATRMASDKPTVPESQQDSQDPHAAPGDFTVPLLNSLQL